jgi:ferredoxin
MFWEGSIEVIYAEHFFMPNNVGNVLIFKKPSKRKIQRYIDKAEAKMTRVCHNIQSGVVVKRGFSRFSQMLGSIQGKMWQGDSKEDYFNRFKSGFQAGSSGKNAPKPKMEERARNGVRIHKGCTACGLCCSICPMDNLEKVGEAITHKCNCTVCYRCVNKCPHKAITVLFHMKPRWQYEGITHD